MREKRGEGKGEKERGQSPNILAESRSCCWLLLFSLFTAE